MTKVKVFWEVGQNSMSRSLGQTLWYNVKGLVTRNAYVKYKSPAYYNSLVMTKVKVFWKAGQNSKSRSLGKNYGVMWKVLSQRIHMWNMKVLSLVAHKLWPSFKCLSTDDDDDVQRRRRRRGYDNSSPDFRHGELKINNTSSHMLLDHCYAFGLSL